MKVYVVVEMAALDIIGMQVFQSKAAANLCYDSIALENQVADNTDLKQELGGTISQAGDDAYAVQLIEREME